MPQPSEVCQQQNPAVLFQQPPSQCETAAAQVRTLPLYASFRASRVFWLTTVSTRAMPLRTTLLQAGRAGRGEGSATGVRPSLQRASMWARCCSPVAAAIQHG